MAVDRLAVSAKAAAAVESAARGRRARAVGIVDMGATTETAAATPALAALVAQWGEPVSAVGTMGPDLALTGMVVAVTAAVASAATVVQGRPGHGRGRLAPHHP